MDAVRAHAARGGMVLGICNGFQILVESGLLPGVLMRNANLRFVCRLQHVTVERADTAFTSCYAEGQAIEIAIAHGEGNYTADADTVRRLEGDGLVGLPLLRRRRAGEGQGQPERLDERDRRHLCAEPACAGMMPHPENLIDPLAGGTDGLPLFLSLAESLAQA